LIEIASAPTMTIVLILILLLYWYLPRRLLPLLIVVLLLLLLRRMRTGRALLLLMRRRNLLLLLLPSVNHYSFHHKVIKYKYYLREIQLLFGYIASFYCTKSTSRPRNLLPTMTWLITRLLLPTMTDTYNDGCYDCYYHSSSIRPFSCQCLRPVCFVTILQSVVQSTFIRWHVFDKEDFAFAYTPFCSWYRQFVWFSTNTFISRIIGSIIVHPLSLHDDWIHILNLFLIFVNNSAGNNLLTVSRLLMMISFHPMIWMLVVIIMMQLLLRSASVTSISIAKILLLLLILILVWN